MIAFYWSISIGGLRHSSTRAEQIISPKQATSGFAVMYSIFLAHGMEQKSGGTGLIGSREFGILRSLAYMKVNIFHF